MTGLEKSELFFKEYGLSLIEEKFKNVSDRICAGLIGQGSDRYGFDDEHSKDHDFCVGFCLYVDEKDRDEFGFELMKEYKKLPEMFMGESTKEKNKSGRSRYGVITYDELFMPILGENYGNLTDHDYLNIPSNYLADATNGKIFYDKGGRFTQIYEKIKNGMSTDVRIKKMSANLAGMAQSGQYNFARTISHGENGASVMAICEFVKYACNFIYLANGKFSPYYKWMLRGLRELSCLSELAYPLEYLLTEENSVKTSAKKSEIIEDICFVVADYLKKNGLSESDSDFLEDHAVSMLKKIKNSEIRNMHILLGAM